MIRHWRAWRRKRSSRARWGDLPGYLSRIGMEMANLRQREAQAAMEAERAATAATAVLRGIRSDLQEIRDQLHRSTEAHRSQVAAESIRRLRAADPKAQIEAAIDRGEFR